MNFSFITTQHFDKSYKDLKKKYHSIKEDLELFKSEFESNPNVGIDLGGGYRKIRVSIKAKNKGKSGGARIITYDLCIKEEINTILLVDIYDKSDKDTMQDFEYKSIVEKYFAE